MSSAEAEFADFAGQKWPDFVRTGVFMGYDIHEAQDVAQNALVKCWQAWERVMGASDSNAYAFRILHNCLRDVRRRPWRRETPVRQPAEDDLVPDSALRLVNADVVDRALRQLTPRTREVVILRYLVGLSERQTATVLRIPLGTVKSRGARGLSQLADDPSLVELAEGTAS